MTYRITHSPSGDEAEALTGEAALVAARTLLEDNEFVGQCRIERGEITVDMVWADNALSYVHLDIKEGR